MFLQTKKGSFGAIRGEPKPLSFSPPAVMSTDDEKLYNYPRDH